MVQQICNCSVEIHVGAKICKVVRMLRRPLISDGVEEQALLRRVEDGSPTRAVAKSLRCDGVSGRNANTKTTAYRRSGLAMRNQNPPAYSCMIPGEADIDAALITHGWECHTRTTVMKVLYWMSARVADDPADSLRRHDDRGSGRRERLNVPRDVQHQMNLPYYYKPRAAREDPTTLAAGFGRRNGSRQRIPGVVRHSCSTIACRPGPYDRSSSPSFLGSELEDRPSAGPSSLPPEGRTLNNIYQLIPENGDPALSTQKQLLSISSWFPQSDSNQSGDPPTACHDSRHAVLLPPRPLFISSSDHFLTSFPPLFDIHDSTADPLPIRSHSECRKYHATDASY
ncbi:hypothetical protein B0H13DRAFT_1871008 [Mycena leptocephala]|nr:hypothetical protein B0H13DRAFT_1871008 [Mycena leptocephala]